MAGETGALPWKCGVCTLLNAPGDLRCNACDNPRETTTTAPPVLRLDAGSAAPKAPAAAPAPVIKPSAGSVGLSASERKAREEEMAAKRQKKEEEKQRILAQAEADRLSRLEQPAPVAQAPAVPRAPAAARSVRLQLRCPQWGRNVVFTCFESTSTLGDLRRALREDLVRGVAGIGDGRLPEDVAAAAEAQVPEEGAIVLAEQVPPRRKFVTPEDMQLTLGDAGLCPSGTLLVDAAPIKIAAPPPPVPEPVPDDSMGEPALPDVGLQQVPLDDDRSDDDDDADGGGSDDDDDDDDDDGPPGPPFFGKGGFGGKGRGRGTGTGTFAGGGGMFGRPLGGAQWPDEDGGQVLGNTAGGGAPTFPSSGGHTTGDTTTEEERKAAREARLAALERRAGPTQQQEQSSESKPAPGASSGAAMPIQDPSRIKGQLGTGASKIARAKEREAILQQMEEDRQRYEERTVAPSAVAAQTQPKAAPASSAVRLQVRCASSGRLVTTSSFSPDDSLLALRNYAAKELELLPGEGADGPELSLAFPPRTAYISESQLASSLKELGLTPSATLLIKGISSVAAPATAEGGPPAASAAAVQCPRGHPMALVASSEEAWCDRCSKALNPGEEVFNCPECDYFECRGCSAREA